MNDSATFEEVAAAIRKSQRIGNSKVITPATQLERDLGITGDDGCELLEDLERGFSIRFGGPGGTLREAFSLNHNQFLFHSEGVGFFAMIAGWFGLILENVKPLSVGELHRVITERQNHRSSSGTGFATHTRQLKEK